MAKKKTEMKLEIEKVITAELSLELTKDMEGITVQATDKEGTVQSLVKFTNEGKLLLFACIEEDFGFVQNGNGYLIPEEME